MKWFSSKEKLPSDQQEVLVKKKGTVNLGRFDKVTESFKLRDGTIVPVQTSEIKWMELVAPEPGH